MKTTNNFRTHKTLSFPLFLLLIVITISCFVTCRSNVNNVVPPAGVMAVNSAQASAPQDFYVDNSKQNTTPIAYTQSTGYFFVNSGNHQTQFQTSGSSTVTGSAALTFDPGNYYSVYLTDGSSESTYQNDRTSPSGSNSRVRFINLSSALTSNVDFSITQGSKSTGLASGLAYKVASTYYDVISASNTFTLAASGSSTVLLSIPVTLQAGKIYTIFISGATTATITYTLVAEN